MDLARTRGIRTGLGLDKLLARFSVRPRSRDTHGALEDASLLAQLVQKMAEDGDESVEKSVVQVRTNVKFDERMDEAGRLMAGMF